MSSYFKKISLVLGLLVLCFTLLPGIANAQEEIPPEEHEVLQGPWSGTTFRFVVKPINTDGFSDDPDLLFVANSCLDETVADDGEDWLFIEASGPNFDGNPKLFALSPCLVALGIAQDQITFDGNNAEGQSALQSSVTGITVNSVIEFDDGTVTLHFGDLYGYGATYIEVTEGVGVAREFLLNAHLIEEVIEQEEIINLEVVPRPTICRDGFLLGDDADIPVAELCVDHGGVFIPGSNWVTSVAECLSLKDDHPELENIQSIDCVATGQTIEDADDEFKEEQYCSGLVIGWILCPIIDGLYAAITWTFENLFQPLLFISPLNNTDTDSNEATQAVYNIWNNFRIIANIAFIFVFIFAIAANSFGFLLTPYDFKKTMPRIAIGFIAVQISFYAVGWLIDIFNILGAGIHGLITAPINDFNVNLDFDLNAVTEGVIAFALAKGTIATVTLAGGIKGLIGLLPMILLPILLFIITAVIILLLRQVVILLLAILSPIALVAWILPNTEGITKFWADLLIKLLVMFPIIMIFISIGELFASIVVNENSSALVQIAGVVALFAPYLLIPASFKLAGSVVGSAVSGFSNMRKGVSGKLLGNVEDQGSYRATQRRIRNKYRTQKSWQRMQDYSGVRKRPDKVYKGVRSRQGAGTKFGRSKAAMRTWKSVSPLGALSTQALMRGTQPIDERMATRTREFKSQLKDLLEYGRDDYIYALFGNNDPLTGKRLDNDAINMAVRYRDDDSFLVVAMTYVLAKARSEEERQAYINSFAKSDQVPEAFKPGIWKGASFGNQAIYRDLKHRDFTKKKRGSDDYGLIKDGKIKDLLREGVDVMNNANLYKHGESYWHAGEEASERLKDVLSKGAGAVDEFDDNPQALKRDVENLSNLRHGLIDNLAKGRLAIGETDEEAFEQGGVGIDGGAKKGQPWRRTDMPKVIATDKIRAQRHAAGQSNWQTYDPSDAEIQQMLRTNVSQQEIETYHQDAIKQILASAPVQGTNSAHQAALEFIRNTDWVDDRNQLSTLVDPSTGINPNSLLS